MKNSPTLLTIAGSDPSGGAGLQRDLAVFQELGARGLSVTTALTAQNEKTFLSLNPVSPEILEDQLLSIETEPIQGIKIGMLGTAKNVEVVIRWIQAMGHRLGPIILDPIFESSMGGSLLDAEGICLLQEKLMPLATVVTPNLSEASRLISHSVTNLKEMRKAAEMILWSMVRQRMANPGRVAGGLPLGTVRLERSSMGCQPTGPGQSVLIKGGHLEGAPTDLLFDGQEFQTFQGERRPGTIHGSGCALSAALLTFLAQGNSLMESVRKAKDQVSRLFR
ncbi:MAG: hydroxymethylpyrimidine/phosphomethylpyrimidine kinase [bacterium]|nr:hydroxymethylpyrimidine/phosphomethylpyrimidine kinase [bacterium]